MVLAAGRGERLRPLTDRTPKPLVEVGGVTLLGRHLERLAAAGFKRAVVNVAHLGEQIVKRFDPGFGTHAPRGIEITWSREPEPLETAGGIALARGLLGDAPFLLVNSDIWCDFDFSRLKSHALGARLAHLVLVPNPAWHPAGDFVLSGGAVGNAAAPRYTYAGISVLSPRLVEGVAAGSKAQLAPLWRAAADRGEVSGELYEGYWNDVGTLERLNALAARLAQS
jgi:MurNAc alpha-1-phosphate uridylyltransferase